MKSLNNSQLISDLLNELIPFIMIIGFYIILNGYNTPGGGFQGGALLSALFIYSYLSNNEPYIKIETIALIEKLALIFIITLPVLFFTFFINSKFPSLNVPYLIITNALIGLKVSCGLSIIFLRFVILEVRWFMKSLDFIKFIDLINVENVSILVFFISLYGLIAGRNIVKSIISLGIMQASIVLFFVSINSEMSNVPPIGVNSISNASDPLPQALTITAIVIGVSVTALTLTMFISLYHRYGSTNWLKVKKKRSDL